jgi:hypothetical protein
MLIRIKSFGESPYFVPRSKSQLRTLGAGSTEDGRTDQ